MKMIAAISRFLSNTCLRGRQNIFMHSSPGDGMAEKLGLSLCSEMFIGATFAPITEENVGVTEPDVSTEPCNASESSAGDIEETSDEPAFYYA